MIHSKIKPNGCDKCNKRFAVSSTLTKHKTTHSDQKSFKFKSSKKSFKSKYQLGSHSKIHSKIKAYERKICKKRFTHSLNLSRHKKANGSAYIRNENGELEHVNKVIKSYKQLKKVVDRLSQVDLSKFSYLN